MSADTHAVAARHAAIERLGRERFDLLVIGGGITGAGVARDAAMRGLAVALVERDDFASGTSSRSSRLVHGGVRYLEHGHLHLVFESSRERRTLLRIAPHLVRPLRFTWPVYRGARIPRWKLGAGLALYDALALFRNVAPHRRLGAAEVIAAEPALAREGLVGGAQYYDAATDDARLTLATVRAAQEAGAVALNHAAAIALDREGDRITGARIGDALTGATIAVRASIVVSAAGPWTDELLAPVVGSAAPAVRGTKGVHIAVPRARVADRGAITLVSRVDGRVMFVLPADDGGAHAIIGTTDTPTAAPPSTVRADRDDVRYLLASANGFFPEARLAEADVVAAWAGIRPLAAAGFGADASSASREHAIARAAPGLVSITGGKLTTYRAMAAEAVDAVARELGRRLPPTPTARAPLPGGSIEDVATEVARAAAITGDEAVARRLVHAHGDGWGAVWSLAREEPRLAERLDPSLPYVGAELVHAARQEMAWTLADLLVRRVPIAFATRDHGRAVALDAARMVAPMLGWDDARVEEEVARYDADISRMFAVG
jgi:glycerol-3-phosphate dehydrogenase